MGNLIEYILAVWLTNIHGFLWASIVCHWLARMNGDKGWARLFRLLTIISFILYVYYLFSQQLIAN